MIENKRKVVSSYVLRVPAGEELISELKSWVQNKDIDSGWFTGIGACKKAKVGRFNTKTKEYEWWEYDKQLELVSLTGNLTRKNGNSSLHIHVVLSDEKGKAMGGHLKEFYTKPTCEIHFKEFEKPITRGQDEESTLDLISE